MRKIVKVVITIFLIIALLLIALMLGASYFFDNYVQQGINKFNHKQQLISLNYVPKAHSWFKKDGRLEVVFKKQKLSTALNTSLDFSLNKIEFSFDKINGSGNLDDFIASMHLQPLKIDGKLDFFLLTLSAKALINTPSLEYLFDDGRCKIDRSKLTVATDNLEALDVNWSFDSLNCTSSLIYAGHSAFDFNLANLNLKLRPSVDYLNQKVFLDEVELDFKKFSSIVSTIYVIGFSPEENVHDRSLSDSVQIDNFSFKTKLYNQDETYQDISFKGNLDLKFAFPYIKNNQMQDLTDLSKLKYDLKFSSFNLNKLKQILKAQDLSFEAIESVLKDKLELNLYNFSFEHEDHKAALNFDSAFVLNSGKVDFSKVKLNGRITLDKYLVDKYMQKQYQAGFDDYIKIGAIKALGSEYSTNFSVENKQLYLNGIKASVASDDNDLEDEALIDTNDNQENL